MRRTLTIALFAALSGSAWAQSTATSPRMRDAYNDTWVQMDAPASPDGLLAAPTSSSTSGDLVVTNAPFETLATINDAGGVDFNWPAIEKCAVKDALAQGWLGKMAMDCRIWLAAHHDGFISAGSGKDDPIPTVPFFKRTP
jgi:hypothetical protein